MTETETQNEPTLPTKRKLDEVPIPENNNSPITQEKTTDKTQNLETNINNPKDTVHELVEEDDDGDEDEDGDYEDEEENGEVVVVDRKGKGLLIEEDKDSSDDDDDDDDSSSELDGGEDSEEAEKDDPLAEVDLDNILPSRTRRKVVHPGVYIANDNHANDDDDSDS